MRTATVEKVAAGIRTGTPAAAGKDEASFAKTILRPNREKVNGQPLYDHGREVAYLREGGTVMYRQMHGSRHILQSPRSLCFGLEPLRAAIRAGAKIVRVLDVEDGKIYECGIWDFNGEHALTIDRGFGEQQALPLQYWKITDPRHPERQLSLLEVAL